MKKKSMKKQLTSFNKKSSMKSLKSLEMLKVKGGDYDYYAGSLSEVTVTPS